MEVKKRRTERQCKNIHSLNMFLTGALRSHVQTTLLLKIIFIIISVENYYL